MQYYYLVDMERTSGNHLCYWKANEFGYTFNIDEAGEYDQFQAIRICTEDLNQNTLMLPITKICN